MYCDILSFDSVWFIKSTPKNSPTVNITVTITYDFILLKISCLIIFNISHFFFCFIFLLI